VGSSGSSVGGEVRVALSSVIAQAQCKHTHTPTPEHKGGNREKKEKDQTKGKGKESVWSNGQVVDVVVVVVEVVVS
jgi:hypothetical protein